MSRDEELCLIFQKVAHQQTKVDDVVDIIVKLDPCEADVAPLSHSLSHMHTVHKHPGQQLSNSRLRQSRPTVSDSVRQCPTVVRQYVRQSGWCTSTLTVRQLSDSPTAVRQPSDSMPDSHLRQLSDSVRQSDSLSDSSDSSDSQGSRLVQRDFGRDSPESV